MTKEKSIKEGLPVTSLYEDHGKPKPKGDFFPRELRHKTLDVDVGGWAAKKQ